MRRDPRLLLLMLATIGLSTTLPAPRAEGYSLQYYTTSSKEIRKKLFGRPPDYVCYWRTHCHFRSGGGCPEAYGLAQFKSAFQVPEPWQVFSMSLEDTLGDPLLIGGQPVNFTIAPCTAGDCEVDSLFPAPPGQKWVQLVSTLEFPYTCAPAMEDSLVFVVRTALIINAPVAVNSPVALWFSDDRDDRVPSMVVQDLYAEAVLDTVHGVDVAYGGNARPLLIQMNPNPARHDVRVEFSVPMPQMVDVAVHSIDGRLVRTLDRRFMEQGRHILNWDGIDALGRRATPGLYVLRIGAGTSSQSAKFAWIH